MSKKGKVWWGEKIAALEGGECLSSERELGFSHALLSYLRPTTEIDKKCATKILLRRARISLKKSVKG